MANGEDGKLTNGRGPWWVWAIERLGIPMSVLAAVFYIVVVQFLPAHQEFLRTVNKQQAEQTQVIRDQTRIIDELRDTAAKSFDIQGKLVEAIDPANIRKLGTMEEEIKTTSKVVEVNGTKLDTIDRKVDDIKSAVKALP